MPIQFCPHDKLKNACIECVRGDLRREVSLHEVAKAFYDLTLMERNQERRRVEDLREEIERLRKSVAKD